MSGAWIKGWMIAIVISGLFSLPSGEALAQIVVPNWKPLPVACLPWRAQQWRDGREEAKQASCHCPPSSTCPDTANNPREYFDILALYQEGLNTDGSVKNTGALTKTKLPPDIFARCCPAPVCPAGTFMAGQPMPTNLNCNCPDGGIFTAGTERITVTTRVEIPASPNIPTTPATASADYSYVHSCTNIVISGDTLTARCATGRTTSAGGSSGPGKTTMWYDSRSRTCYKSYRDGSSEVIPCSEMEEVAEYVPASINNVHECAAIHNNAGNLQCTRDSSRKLEPTYEDRTSLQWVTVLTNTGVCGCGPNEEAISNPIRDTNAFRIRENGDLKAVPSTMNTYTTCQPNPPTWTPTGDGGGDGGDGGGDCLSGDAQLVRADGTRVSLATLVAGDEVKGKDGNVKIRALTRVEHAVGPVFYRINDLPFLITGDHPVETKDGWKTVDPEVKKDGKNYDRLEVGDVLVGAAGEVKVTSIKVVTQEARKGAYNIATEGDKPVSVGGVSVKPFTSFDIGY